MLTSWFIKKLTDFGKVVIIPGNHDFLENNTQRLDSITPVVELLNSPHINYLKDSGPYIDDNIQWIVYSLYQHNERLNLKDRMVKLMLVLFHGVIQGMSTDIGFKLKMVMIN